MSVDVEQLYERYGPMVLRRCRALLKNEARAVDALHDVFVSSGARRGGVGRALVDAMARALEALGAPRVVLSTMVGNEAAQRVFRSCGFRPTMMEMTRDAIPPR